MEQNRHWWEGYPWRMIQTNLREIDMEDIEAASYAQSLADFGATVVTLNAAGIIASYDTKLPFHTKSEYLHGSSLKEIVEACHQRGIRVIARMDFSKIRFPLYEQHPDWAYRDKDGNILNYNGNVQTCPNGGYQGEAVFEILKEALTEIPFDGVFCNMAGFLVVDYNGVYHGPCHCENCKRLFKEKYDEEVPERDDFRNPAYRKYAAFKSACLKAHKEKMVATIRGISSEIAINGVDYIRTESNLDIGRPQWMYNASSNARLSSGAEKVRPADNACVDFSGFRYRDISVSPHLVALRHGQTLANAGSLSLFIMGRLDNHRDVSSYGPTRRAFAFHAAHEDLFTHMRSAAKTVLVRSNMMAREDPEGYGWVRALTESHIPFDEIKADELKDIKQLQEKELLILGDMRAASPKLLALADEFAEQGGTVIAAGETGLTKDGCALQCLGITSIISNEHACMSSMFEIQEGEKTVFPHCAETPYILPGSDIIRFTGDPAAKKYLRLIPEHPFGPPELCYYTEVTEDPGVTVMPYGQGRGIYLPFKPAALLWKEGFRNTLSFLQDVLFSLAGAQSIAPELTPMVEVTLNETMGKYFIQLVNTSGVFGNSFHSPLPVFDIDLILPSTAGTKAIALNGGSVVCETQKDQLLLHLNQLKEYEAIIIE